MTESNLSKSDLLEICSSLGLSTEGNKMDLIQKLKEYSGVTTRGKGKEKETLTSTSNLGQEIADNVSIISDHTETSAVLDVNPEGRAQTLRDLLQNEKRTTWGIPLDNLPRNVEELPDCQPQVDREMKKWKQSCGKKNNGVWRKKTLAKRINARSMEVLQCQQYTSPRVFVGPFKVEPRGQVDKNIR
ncbi:5758_t:CDS:2 [Cetraspora pellucida]|uniref:5758_t:CDS:1 n=1 Tax=Cetraspora pellucida TaxID=1433469 RepID=A0A9N9NL46_9GLOM|nr:5758_t:CDS:2 [Cetraspora pellucida]